MIVNWGVLFGAFDPNAAIELGQNNFFIFPSLAAYKQLKSAFMFIYSVFKGSFSPVAERRAARQ